MNLNLLQYLVLNYTNEGDVVLDPMAGTGATGVICAFKEFVEGIKEVNEE